MNDWTSDLRLISDFCDESADLPNCTNYIPKRKFKRSMYDYYDSSDEDDEVQTDSKETKNNLVDNNFQYPKRGIGRGYRIQKGFTNEPVGSVDFDFNTDTTNLIRSVSNVNYSNDLLEETFNSQVCVDSAISEANKITKENAIPERPLSEILGGCRKPTKNMKLSNIISVKSYKSESAVNSTNSKHDVEKNELFDLQSQVEFPALS